MTVKRKVVRDGVIRAEVIHVDPTTGNSADDLVKFAAQSLAASEPAQMVAAYRRHAEAMLKVLPNANKPLSKANRSEVRKPENNRRLAAEAVLRQADETMTYIEQNNAVLAVQSAMWMMCSVWFLDVKEVEPEIVTGVKTRGGAARGNQMRKKTAAELHAEWQVLANEKWADPQHANKGNIAIAKLIARPGEKPGTIRNRIKKLS